VYNVSCAAAAVAMMKCERMKKSRDKEKVYVKRITHTLETINWLHALNKRHLISPAAF